MPPSKYGYIWPQLASAGWLSVARPVLRSPRAGLKNMDAGDEAITDPRERDQVGAQSRAVHIRSELTGIVVAALLALLPL